MAKHWVYKYNDFTIEVLNKNLNGSELYVNGELCDKKKGISLSDHLTVTLASGEIVSATLEGAFSIECSLTINGKPQEPVEVK